MKSRQKQERKFLSGVILGALFLSSCGPSYPKDRVAESLVKLCREEYHLEVKAQVAKTTLGVLATIPGLIDELMRQAALADSVVPSPVLVEGNYAQDRFQFQFLATGTFSRVKKREESRKKRGEEQSEASKALDHVSTAIHRVALSTDAPLEFYSLIARDPGPANLDVLFSGHLDDLRRTVFLGISRGELQLRSRASIRPQPEAIARQTVTSFFQNLSKRPLPQLISRYTAPSKHAGELFPKILQLAVDLQGREKELLDASFPVRQITESQCLCFVPLSAVGQSGAVLFTVQLLKENQGVFLDIERLDSALLPDRYRYLGPPEKWIDFFYLEPLDLPRFLSEQIAKRVAAEFEPFEEEPKKSPPQKKEPPPQPGTSDDVTRVLVETSAYLFNSYQFDGFKELGVTDLLKGTRWQVPARDVPLYYRRRNSPELKPLP